MKYAFKLLVILITILAKPVFADITDGWERLGKEKVSSRLERDEIRIASKGFIKQIVIEVRGAAVFFESVNVHLGNSEVMDFPIRSIVRVGERSRVFDLPGKARIIKKVVFIHQKVKDSNKAEIVLWGRK
jgi:hypothetical protein